MLFPYLFSASFPECIVIELCKHTGVPLKTVSTFFNMEASFKLQSVEHNYEIFASIFGVYTFNIFQSI